MIIQENDNIMTGTSQKQIAANRRNAANSTGPRTKAGKRASSRNALKHGLLAQASLIDAGDGKEDATELGKLLLRLIDDYQPQREVERLLVEKIVTCI